MLVRPHLMLSQSSNTFVTFLIHERACTRRRQGLGYMYHENLQTTQSFLLLQATIFPLLAAKRFGGHPLKRLRVVNLPTPPRRHYSHSKLSFSAHRAVPDRQLFLWLCCHSKLSFSDCRADSYSYGGQALAYSLVPLATRKATYPHPSPPSDRSAPVPSPPRHGGSTY